MKKDDLKKWDVLIGIDGKVKRINLKWKDASKKEMDSKKLKSVKISF